MTATPSPRMDRLRISEDAALTAAPAEGRAAESGSRLPARQSDQPLPDVSVVIPMRNEEENVVPLYTELRDVLSASSLAWEAIFVDDGSTDQSVATLLGIAGNDPRVTVVQFARRFGQTAALDAGFRLARGRVLVPMDADQQNDPRDIPALVAALDQPPGYDVVSGWRKDRQDKFLSRRLPSLLANRLIARATWTRIHDFGCTLKAYRREALEDIKIYGEMHRFLPAICQWRGARVTERVVNHRPRLRGTSKYGLRRTAKVMLDLVTVKFLGDYLTKPLYFFAKIGLLSMSAAMLSLGIAVAQKFGYLYSGPEGLSLNRNVLVLFAMMLFLVTVMILMMGVISELLVRIYHESQGRAPYRVRSITRCAADAPGRSDGRSDLLPFPVMDPFPKFSAAQLSVPRAVDEKRAVTTCSQ